MHLADASRRFESFLRANQRSRHTVTSYLRDLATFAGWLRRHRLSLDVRRVTPDLLCRFITSPAASQMADGAPKQPSSVDKIKMSMRAFFHYLVLARVIANNPAAVLKRVRSRPKPPEILTHPERTRLLRAAARRGGPNALRDRVILELLLTTGVRLDALVGLDVGDVRLAERRLVVRRLKGGGESIKPIASRVRPLLARHLRRREALRPRATALLVSRRGTRLGPRQVQIIVACHAKAAGIEKRVTPHALRHTFATRLYEKTKDLLLVSRALDHSHLAITQLYARVSDGALAEAVERL